MKILQHISQQLIKSSASTNSFCRNISYIQGQEPEPRIREYFYYIDHQGMLFLDDAKMKNFTSCFKEKKFLKFFFSRLKLNDTEKYENEFPYISPCGRERNYIRCDDLPIVFTHIIKDKNDTEKLSYAHGGDQLIVDFEPNKIHMHPVTGRVYYPAWEKVGGIGLIRSKLAIELSKYFCFENSATESPTHLFWNEFKHELDSSWIKNTIFNQRKCENKALIE